MECVRMWAFASAWIPSNLELNYIVLDRILLFQIFPKRQFVWAILFWKHACWERDWARRTDEVCGHPFLFLHQSLQAHAVPGNSSQVNVCCITCICYICVPAPVSTGTCSSYCCIYICYMCIKRTLFLRIKFFVLINSVFLSLLCVWILF